MLHRRGVNIELRGAGFQVSHRLLKRMVVFSLAPGRNSRGQLWNQFKNAGVFDLLVIQLVGFKRARARYNRGVTESAWRTQEAIACLGTMVGVR